MVREWWDAQSDDQQNVPQTWHERHTNPHTHTRTFTSTHECLRCRRTKKRINNAQHNRVMMFVQEDEKSDTKTQSKSRTAHKACEKCVCGGAVVVGIRSRRCLQAEHRTVVFNVFECVNTYSFLPQLKCASACRFAQVVCRCKMNQGLLYDHMATDGSVTGGSERTPAPTTSYLSRVQQKERERESEL